MGEWRGLCAGISIRNQRTSIIHFQQHRQSRCCFYIPTSAAPSAGTTWNPAFCVLPVPEIHQIELKTAPVLQENLCFVWYRCCFVFCSNLSVVQQSSCSVFRCIFCVPRQRLAPGAWAPIWPEVCRHGLYFIARHLLSCVSPIWSCLRNRLKRVILSS